MVETSTLKTAGSDNGENKLHSIDNLSTEKRNKLNRQSTEVKDFFLCFKIPSGAVQTMSPG